jgi:pimeloyl-ACP methyl ester carboxylesterase
VNLKAELEPLADYVQVLYYDQRGHGRSNRSTPEFWNLRTSRSTATDPTPPKNCSSGVADRSRLPTSTGTTSARKRPASTLGACWTWSNARC